MRRAWRWFLFSCKRFLRRPSFLVVLLLLPLITFGTGRLERRGNTDIRIAVCLQEEGAPAEEMSLERELMEELLRYGVPRDTGNTEEDGEKLRGGMFRFYVCDEEEQLREEVSSRRAECGFAIGRDLRERLKNGDYKRCIKVCTAPSSVTARLASETVAAALLRLYDRELFQDYMEEKGGTLSSQARKVYERWKENGSTFHFQYEYVTMSEDGQAGGQVRLPEQETATVFPWRGIAAVFVFAAGLYSAALSRMDEEKGLFQALFGGERQICVFAAFLGPVCLAAAAGWAAVLAGSASLFWAAGQTMLAGQAGMAGQTVIVGQAGMIGWRVVSAAGRELVLMAGYGAAVAVFSWGIRLLFRRPGLIGGAAIFLPAGSLVFCPVFVDVGRYVPEFAAVGKLFLPGLYLRLFY